MYEVTDTWAISLIKSSGITGEQAKKFGGKFLELPRASNAKIMMEETTNSLKSSQKEIMSIVDDEIKEFLAEKGQVGTASATYILKALQANGMKIVRDVSSEPNQKIVVYLSIGNSDDKLTQREWSNFIKDIEDRVLSMATEVHGSWFSNPTDPWQNACWCLVFKPARIPAARLVVEEIRKYYNQDSAAWSVTETEFI